MYSAVYGLRSVSDQTRFESRSSPRCKNFQASSVIGCTLSVSQESSSGRFLSARAVAASASMFASCRQPGHDGNWHCVTGAPHCLRRFGCRRRDVAATSGFGETKSFGRKAKIKFRQTGQQNADLWDHSIKIVAWNRESCHARVCRPPTRLAIAVREGGQLRGRAAIDAGESDQRDRRGARLGRGENLGFLCWKGDVGTLVAGTD